MKREKESLTSGGFPSSRGTLIGEGITPGGVPYSLVEYPDGQIFRFVKIGKEVNFGSWPERRKRK